jgi:hypothetical protein
MNLWSEPTMTDSIRWHRSMLPTELRQLIDRVLIELWSFTGMGNFGSGREIE